MPNPTLFDLDALGDPFNGLTHPPDPCTPRRIGTGPAGEMCGTCAHRCRCRTRAGNVFQKCGLVRAAWTNGSGTDIRAGWSACADWQKRTGEVEETHI